MRFKAIIPKKLVFDAKRMERVIENTLDARALDVQVDFDTTVATWKNKPSFTIAVKKGERLVSTDNPIYGMLNAGTARHPIAARNARALSFMRTGFRAKSRPGYVGSNKGRPANSDPTVVKSVMHPGTEARHWSSTIAIRWRKRFWRLFQDALDYEASR